MDEEGRGPISGASSMASGRDGLPDTRTPTLASMRVDVCRRAAVRAPEDARAAPPRSSPQAEDIVRPRLVAPRSTAANPDGAAPHRPSLRASACGEPLTAPIYKSEE